METRRASRGFCSPGRAECLLGQAYSFLGDYGLAINFLRRTVTSLEGDLIRERFGQASLPSVVSRAYLARSLAAHGEFAEAIAQREEGIRIAQGVDHLVSQVSAHLGMSSFHLAKGDLDKAVPCSNIAWPSATAGRAGDKFIIPGNVEHSAVVGPEDCVFFGSERI